MTFGIAFILQMLVGLLASNGEPAGTQGYAYQIEAIQIKVLPKNAQDAASARRCL